MQVVKNTPPAADMELIQKMEEAQFEGGEPIDPLSLPKLPKDYQIVCPEDIAVRFHTQGMKLMRKHRNNWTQEKLMRKLFEEFPSVKIILPSDASK